MIYPENFESKIEFDAVKQLIGGFCKSKRGLQYVENLSFLTDFDRINLLLSQAEEFRQLLLGKFSLPASDMIDMTDVLESIIVPGTFIQQEDLFELKRSISEITEILKSFSKVEPAKLLTLKPILERIRIDPGINVSISALIDERGGIRDDASATLKDIRKSISAKKSAVDRKIAQTLRQARQAGWVASDAEVTIRDGRQVIPFSATHKRKIRGFVLDESATGQTVYIEPAEVLEMNNELRELHSAEGREIIRILKSFTDFLRPHTTDLTEAYEMIGLIDFIHAKAQFAIMIKASKPVLKPEPEINWSQAFHPLLYLHLQKAGKQVVPLDLALNKEQRILVISGPNAGGKSVCLKTIAMLQYMLQCGLLIPVRDGSFSGIFQHLLIDIGDEQSIENDLSTYSSHLMNMKSFIELADKRALFFIDEFGAGTEPQFGGAIAEAILEKLNRNGAFGVVTTHYSNLKLLAGRISGIINGAMMFNTEQMEPMYRLNIGKPGSSFAFEIAEKIGFPEEVLKEAGLKTGTKQMEFERQLNQLDLDKKEVERQKEQLRLADEFLSDMIDKYEKLKSNLESNREDILKKARNEAMEMIRSSNRLIENTIREIRETQAEKSKTKVLREKIKEKEQEIKPVPEKPITRQEKLKTIPTIAEKSDVEKPAISEIIKIGDLVRVPEQSITGEVVGVKDDEVVIAFNSVIFRTSKDKVEKEFHTDATKKQKVIRKTSYSGMLDDMHDKLATFRLQLDVRGKRGEEALDMVRKYVDEAILLNVKEFRILHGKGYGILRNLVHEYLRSVSEIRQFNDEHIERGGHGITVVILK